MSATAQPAAPSRWLFGPGIDVFLGYGAAYLISVPILVGLSLRGQGTPAEWVPAALALVVSIPHYGATLLRVYQRAEDRAKYAVFTVWLTLLVAALFGTALWVPALGSLLLTIYVTWSPWHFSGQNYGLFLMYMRRAGYDPAAIKRPLYASFILSAGVAITAMHMAASRGSFAPNATDASNTYAMLRLGIPATLAYGMTAAAALGWLACMGLVWARLRGAVRFSEMGPLGVLVGMQALWYLPSAAAVTGLFDPGQAGFAFTAIWIAVAHAAQYLWVTYYYARREGRHRNVATFYGKAMLAGCLILAPILLLAPGLFGSVAPGAAGIAVLTITVLNLHHFILDGAIWKLRDGRVARVLLRGEEAPSTPEPIGPQRRFRPVAIAVWGLALLSLVAQVELVRLYIDATRTTVEAQAFRRTASTLAWFGQDTQRLWARAGRELERSGDEAAALASYRRSIQFGNPPPWVASRTAALLLDGEAAGKPRSLAEARRLALYLVKRLGNTRPEGYQTLARVHEHAGEWELAERAAAQGLKVAEAQGSAESVAVLKRQLDSYRRRERAADPPPVVRPDESAAEPAAPTY